MENFLATNAEAALLLLAALIIAILVSSAQIDFQKYAKVISLSLIFLLLSAALLLFSESAFKDVVIKVYTIGLTLSISFYAIFYRKRGE